MYGIRVITHTDHKPLLYLYSMPLVNSRVARMIEELNDIDYKLRYIHGKIIAVTNVLLRALIGTILEDPESPLVNELLKGSSELKMPGGDSL